MTDTICSVFPKRRYSMAELWLRIFDASTPGACFSSAAAMRAAPPNPTPAITAVVSQTNLRTCLSLVWHGRFPFLPVEGGGNDYLPACRYNVLTSSSDIARS